MLHLSAAVSYYHFNQPTDMRKGFDSLTGSLQQHLGMSVTNGSIFIFFNKKRNQVKLLLREGDGQSLYYKRLEAGNSELPAALGGNSQITTQQLQLILQGIQLKSVQMKKRHQRPVAKLSSDTPSPIDQ